MSFYDGAKEGECIEVKPNIWKYTYNGNDKLFNKDVGTLWFFCNEGNNNCKTTMDSQSRKLDYAVKKTTPFDFDESNMDDTIDSILTKDLEFYHMGHASSDENTKGGALYVYSTSNPSTRFDSIEIAKGTDGIRVSTYNDVVIDNLQISFFGRHGVSVNSVANITITNCEISFIGGMVQRYHATEHWALRLGNGIQSYGSIEAKTNFPVKGGYVAQNNYIYEIYDAGLTFQFTAKPAKNSKVEKLLYDNNVVEYCSYNIEY
jgi:hypothetical protein